MADTSTVSAVAVRRRVLDAVVAVVLFLNCIVTAFASIPQKVAKASLMLVRSPGKRGPATATARMVAWAVAEGP